MRAEGRHADWPPDRRRRRSASGLRRVGPRLQSWQPEFGLLEIRIGADGTGVGKLAHADKITFNAKTHLLELADFASEPVRLAGVRSEKN
jgi:hypothetical protein